jgi:ATP-dependent DNA helicase RecG
MATRELKELVDAGVVEQSGTRGSASYQLTARARGRGADAPNEAAVLAALGDAEMSRQDLESASGLSKDQVQYALQTLQRKGRVTRIGKPQSRAVRWAATR